MSRSRSGRHPPDTAQPLMLLGEVWLDVGRDHPDPELSATHGARSFGPSTSSTLSPRRNWPPSETRRYSTPRHEEVVQRAGVVAEGSDPGGDFLEASFYLSAWPISARTLAHAPFRRLRRSFSDTRVSGVAAVQVNRESR